MKKNKNLSLKTRTITIIVICALALLVVGALIVFTITNDKSSTTFETSTAKETVTSEQDNTSSNTEIQEDSEISTNLNIRNEELDIGLKNEYRFLYFSDSHIEVPSDTESSQTVEDYVESRAFGIEGITSSEMFTQFIDYANAQNCNAVLLAGDIVDSPTASNIEFLRNSFNNLNVPYLYVMGNHDWTYPWEYFTATSYDKYLSLFNEFTNNDTSVQMIEYDDLIILGVDDSKGQLADDAYNTVKKILTSDKPVIIVMHVPLANDDLVKQTTEVWSSPVVTGDGGTKPNKITTKFMKLIYAENSPVVAVLAGHIHFYTKENLNDNIVQYTNDPGYAGAGIMLTVK